MAPSSGGGVLFSCYSCDGESGFVRAFVFAEWRLIVAAVRRVYVYLYTFLSKVCGEKY